MAAQRKGGGLTVTIIRRAMEAQLRALGFAEESWVWLDRPNKLVVLVGTKMRTLHLRAGLSQRALGFDMARVMGWAEGLGLDLAPAQLRMNGLAAHEGGQLAMQV